MKHVSQKPEVSYRNEALERLNVKAALEATVVLFVDEDEMLLKTQSRLFALIDRSSVVAELNSMDG